jgi:hypothetical protein
VNFHVLFITFLPSRNIVSLLLKYTNKDILICQVTPNNSEKIIKGQKMFASTIVENGLPSF